MSGGSASVVSYRNSTSNHNAEFSTSPWTRLYLIEILHQTTTASLKPHRKRSCILSKFYIKPQLWVTWAICMSSCILSKFYIKPQLHPMDECPAIRCILSKFYIKPQRILLNSLLIGVVSYRNSTSNHNWNNRILSKIAVVSYRNSTSNHNWRTMRDWSEALYLIEILHQTTTVGGVGYRCIRLYLIEILHQTTTLTTVGRTQIGCILSKFYIKPQHMDDAGSGGKGCILSKFYIKPQLALYSR